jgi:hypothetical protein
MSIKINYLLNYDLLETSCGTISNPNATYCSLKHSDSTLSSLIDVSSY